MSATKTTFYLDDDLRQHLKGLAATLDRTVTDLLAEGARLVIDRHQGEVDRESLHRRAAAARERLRRGLYEGTSATGAIDNVLYTSARSLSAGEMCLSGGSRPDHRGPPTAKFQPIEPAIQSSRPPGWLVGPDG